MEIKVWQRLVLYVLKSIPAEGFYANAFLQNYRFCRSSVLLHETCRLHVIFRYIYFLYYIGLHYLMRWNFTGRKPLHEFLASTIDSNHH